MSKAPVHVFSIVTEGVVIDPQNYYTTTLMYPKGFISINELNDCCKVMTINYTCTIIIETNCTF